VVEAEVFGVAGRAPRRCCVVDRAQVITPPTSLQPWLVSSEVASAMENGYGPCPWFSFWLAETHWLAGCLRMGDSQAADGPRSGPVPV